MKIAKKYENINWKQCQIELFKLQSEILKAFRTAGGMVKEGYLIARGKKKIKF